MAATQSSPPTSTSSSSSLASRRPLARTPLPQFTLPRQPGFPRAAARGAAAATAADGGSPPTPASASGSASTSTSTSTPRQPSASPAYSAESSPGYSTAAGTKATTSTTGTQLAHPHRASSHSPYQSHGRHPVGGAAIRRPRLAPRPGPLIHPHDPKVTSIAITNAVANAVKDGASTSAGAAAAGDASKSPTSPPARRPLPDSPGAAGQSSPSRNTQRLPPISSLISPMDRAGLGFLATQTNMQWRTLPRPLPPTPVQLQVSPIIQDRPFPCDMCSQRFSRNHDLKRHKRIHIAAKPFPCPTCDKKFSRSDALKRHRLVKACNMGDVKPVKAVGDQPVNTGAKSPPVSPEVEREAEPEPDPPASSDPAVPSSSQLPSPES